MSGGFRALFAGANLNVRTLFAKFSEFRNTIVDHDFDLVGVTETWLRAAEAFFLILMDIILFIMTELPDGVALVSM